MIICDECGRKNDDEYKFCLGCGSPLSKDESPEPEETSQPDMVVCPFCGAEQPSNFKFCGSCGEKIPDDAAAVGKGGGADERSAEASQPGGAVEEDAPPPMPQGAGSSQPGSSQPGGAAAEESAVKSTHPGGPASGVGATEIAARLVVIRPDGTEGASIEVPRDSLTLGRDSNVEALSDDPFLSPSHATIVPGEDGYVIRDEDSLNGIFREVRQEIELSDGDQIRIGQELLEFDHYPDEGGTESGGQVEKAGSPDPGYWGRLSVIAGPGRHSEAFALKNDEITIGRETGDIVFRDDGFVSGSHAQVARTEDGRVVLRDLNSSNGTFLRLREDYTMEDGERVLMGQQLFRLEGN